MVTICQLNSDNIFFSLSLDSSNNLVISPKGRLTALLGVKDLIVVETENATLVCLGGNTSDETVPEVALVRK